MNLNKNMMRVLKAIIDDPKLSNTDISRSLNITSAAVGKIREKLEKNGIIKGYDADLNYDALGIGTFVVCHVKIKSNGWKNEGKIGVQDIIASNPNTIAVYRVPGREITHILFCGFRNTKEMDRFFNEFQFQKSEYIDIAESFVFSNENIIKDSMNDLFIKIIEESDGKQIVEPDIFFGIKGED